MKDHYIKAVYELLIDGQEPTAVFAGLDRVLQVHGHGSLRSSILRGVERLSQNAKPDTLATVVVASSRQATALQSEIAVALKTIGTDQEPNFVVDPNLIGGFVAKTKSLMIDRSYRRHLLSLYRAITK